MGVYLRAALFSKKNGFVVLVKFSTFKTRLLIPKVQERVLWESNKYNYFNLKNTSCN